MPKYNFQSLSPQDFEELTRDLLQAEWGVAIESFRGGRDQGIDLRCIRGLDQKTIVQCKHFLQSGFAKLLAHLVNSELPKVRILHPSRYVVATTLRLSPQNKTEIVAGMAPFIANENDVIGGDDLEALLSRHPRVEQANIKLWLTSTAVLTNVLHNAERCRTDFEVQRVQRKLPLYVRNRTIAQAQGILDSSRILILSGPPGIGKTTLAEMLLFSHLDMGFEPVVIESEVKEGRKLFKQNEKQIFYFDDFLGQTFLGDSRDYFTANQDRAIVELMEMIRTSPESRFILTTREHILQSAFRLSERLSHSTLIQDRIVLTMDEYSYADRARMLYNHVYFSDLPTGHKRQLATDDFFLEIIRHRHFNPRLIEWMTSYTRLRKISEIGYRHYVIGLLDNPAQLWEHAFNSQISEAARSILLCLYSTGEPRNQQDLGPEFQAIHRIRSHKYNFRTSSSDFLDALRELDGAFLSYSRGRVNFLNPSVKEYVGSAIAASDQVTDDLLNGAIRFKQVIDLWRLAARSQNSPSRRLLHTANPKFVSRINELLSTEKYRWYRGDDGKTYGETIDASMEERLLFLAQVADNEKTPHAAKTLEPLTQALLEAMKSSYTSTYFGVRLLEDLNDFIWFNENIGVNVRKELADRLISHASTIGADDWVYLLELPEKYPELDSAGQEQLQRAFDHFKTSGIQDDIRNTSSVDEKKSLLDDLDRLTTISGHAFNDVKERLKEQIESLEDIGSNLIDGGERSRMLGTRSPPIEVLTEDEVRDMFKTLIDET